MSAAARLQKTLAKDHQNSIGHLLNANGNYTEILELLLSTHFPDSTVS